MTPPPASASWLHRGPRSGFETVFVDRRDGGWLLDGCTVAAEGPTSWIVRYSVRTDDRWLTRSAEVEARTATGVRRVALQTDGEGRWRVDGRLEPLLDGCLDVDLEASAVTNTLPVHRLALRPGEQRSTPAAYVRAATAEVERLEQSYRGLTTGAESSVLGYEAPAYDVRCEIVVDSAGFVLDYPGIATRVA